jgi:hypothetical protein
MTSARMILLLEGFIGKINMAGNDPLVPVVTRLHSCLNILGIYRFIWSGYLILKLKCS